MSINNQDEIVAVAKIIFVRMAGQISGIAVTDKHWETAYKGWVGNPALFSMVEACMDAANDILRMLKTTKS